MFDTKNVFITSVFLTNYRIENSDGTNVFYDYYDNEIMFRKD
jgi:hypothetical protein